MIPKTNKNIIWESCYIKIDFKVKDNEAKDFLTKNNDLLNVMFRGTPCRYNIIVTQPCTSKKRSGAERSTYMIDESAAWTWCECVCPSILGKVVILYGSWEQYPGCSTEHSRLPITSEIIKKSTKKTLEISHKVFYIPNILFGISKYFGLFDITTKTR